MKTFPGKMKTFPREIPYLFEWKVEWRFQKYNNIKKKGQWKMDALKKSW